MPVENPAEPHGPPKPSDPLGPTEPINTSAAATPSDPSVTASPASFPFVSPTEFPMFSGRVIQAMTNLPHVIYKDSETGTWETDHARGNSALYSSFYFLHQQTSWDTLLVGWTGELHSEDGPGGPETSDDPLYLTDEEKRGIEAKIRASSGSQAVYPVWLLGKNQLRWRQYAENVIWPALHYIQSQASDGRDESRWWHDYIKFNEAYAEKIVALHKPGDVIWVNDYYLLLLPQLLRMALPDAHIVLFLHAPFPSSEYFRCLSKRKQLLEGMLGANLVVFQADSFVRHFVSACSRLLGVEASPTHVAAFGVHVRVAALPIGIDAARVEADCFGSSNEVAAKLKSFREFFRGQKLIVGRDRLDSVRGVVQKLQAFQLFLQLYPEWIGRVVLIQVSAPSVLHSHRIEAKVAELVSAINGTYGTLNYTPVLHYAMRIARPEYLALLQAADLSLVTSVRDGMNTTALEFVVCQKTNCSPILLSEFTGTAEALSSAGVMLINPWDSVSVAEKINECLLMSQDEKQAREARLYGVVKERTVQKWTHLILKRLGTELQSQERTHMTPALDRPLLYECYSAAKRRLFLFDYDGTLTPIVRDPAAAIPSARLLRLLGKLAADPRNKVWIISGRDQKFLDTWLGSRMPSLGLSAEHGCFFKAVGSTTWVNLAEKMDMTWQKDVLDIFQYYTERTQGSSIEVKKAALTWHYRRADPDFGQFQARECRNHLELTVAKKYDVEVMAGKANIEVRPRFVNKGEIVKKLVLEDSENLPDFVLCLGDDATDEDMFKMLNEIGEEHYGKKSQQEQNPPDSEGANGDDKGLEINCKTRGAAPTGAPASLTRRQSLPATELFSDLAIDASPAPALEEPVSNVSSVADFGSLQKDTTTAAQRRLGPVDRHIFPVTVGPASKMTVARAHLLDPQQVLETIGLLVGEVSLLEGAGSVTIDDRGHVRNPELRKGKIHET